MSYESTMVVLYGIKISEEIARKIYENEFDKAEGTFKNQDMYKNVLFRRLSQNQNNEGKQLTPVSPYKHHCEGTDSFVFYPKMWADNVDSRTNSLIYQPTRQHYLGIYVGSNGYAYKDKILHFIRKPPREAIQNFQDCIRPLMSKYNILEEPDVQVVNQVW
jgi:hypothetical protein